MQRNNLSRNGLGTEPQRCRRRLSNFSPLSRTRPGPKYSQNYLPSAPGLSQLNSKKQLKIIAVSLIFFLLCLSGCTPSNRYWLPNSPNQQSTQSHLRTNLYGDFQGWEPVDFAAKPFNSLTQRSFCQEGGDFDPDISSDGKWITISSLRHSPNPDIYIKQVNGATVTRLTSDPASEIQPSFSPQSDKVAYAGNRSGNWDIYVVGVDGSNPTQITSSVGNELHPSWSPDGKQLVYCCLEPRSQQWELWIVDVENPGIKKWIGYGLFPSWCPNSDTPKIAFQQARYRGSKWFGIWTVDLVEGEAKYPTAIIESVNYACLCPSWSPDGAKIAYGTISRNIYEETNEPALDLDSGEDIWIIDIDGRNNLRLTQADAGNFSPSWSPDGDIFFCSDRKGVENIWSVKPHTVNFNRPTPVDLTRHPQSNIRSNYDY